MKRAVMLLALSLSLSLTGCISFTPSGPIGDPVSPAKVTSKRSAQMADVVISSPDLKDEQRQNISRQLTEQISRYVEKGGYYQSVIAFPARMGEHDVQLKFNLTSLKGKRTPHPAYIPGALLTLTIWIWVNGPVYVDSYDLAGELVVEDRNGKVLARAAEKVNEKKNLGIYNGEYWAPSLGRFQLRDMIGRLLDKTSAQLPAANTGAQ
ncbi:hypothetical protein AUC61_21965 [Pseudomonas sp. S25]|uniref:Lipoprotein n=1 Tax=Pseudomonas maioricensis TaxID=1766623 RepID=A0ABS9ZNQ6_9PSED|nr:hypothetical protein [Pseudomonas sp. S25]